MRFSITLQDGSQRFLRADSLEQAEDAAERLLGPLVAGAVLHEAPEESRRPLPSSDISTRANSRGLWSGKFPRMYGGEHW